MDRLDFPPDREVDFLALGRLCIDLNANEIHRPMEETRTFTRYLGGSPANIAIAAARLGLRTGFIGKVGKDQFGRFIIKYLEENGILTENVLVDDTGALTGLAFTEIRSPKECSLLMYRDNVADLKIGPREVREDLISRAKCLLISGTALAKSPSREAAFVAVEYARRHGLRVFFDIDYRPYSWISNEETAVYCSLLAEKCDIIIGTRDEFDIAESISPPPRLKELPEESSGGVEGDRATAQSLFDHGASIVLIKHGKRGSIAYTKDGEVFKGRVFPAKIVKTFGAGDSYAGAFIYSLVEGRSIEEAMEYGAAAASLVISSHSCSDAMPTAAQIDDFIEGCDSGRLGKDSGWV